MQGGNKKEMSNSGRGLFRDLRTPWKGEQRPSLEGVDAMGNGGRARLIPGNPEAEIGEPLSPHKRSFDGEHFRSVPFRAESLSRSATLWVCIGSVLASFILFAAAAFSVASQSAAETAPTRAKRPGTFVQQPAEAKPPSQGDFRRDHKGGA